MEKNYFGHFMGAVELGGLLAVVDTRDMDNIVAALALTVPDQSAWIGLNDIQTEGSLVWIDGMTPFDFSGFDATEEEDNVLSPNQDCVVLNKSNSFSWSHQDCELEQHAIYQLPSSLLQTGTKAQADAAGLTSCVNSVGEQVYTARGSSPLMYCLSVSDLDYMEHFMSAVELGGLLAVVNTVELDNLITNLAMAAPDNGAWIGLNDIHQEGKLVWSDGVTPYDFSSFAFGEPSAIFPDEDCVEVSPFNNFFWADGNCAVKKHAIYQLPRTLLRTATRAQAKQFGILLCVDGDGNQLFSL